MGDIAAQLDYAGAFPLQMPHVDPWPFPNQSAVTTASNFCQTSSDKTSSGLIIPISAMCRALRFPSRGSSRCRLGYQTVKVDSVQQNVSVENTRFARPSVPSARK